MSQEPEPEPEIDIGPGPDSLGLRAGSKLHELFWLFAPFGQRKLRELVEHARAYAQHHHVDAAFRRLHFREGWQISFHPAAQDIRLSLDGGYIVIDARTFEAGPGYHAFVVGFIDYLTRHCQWTWELRKTALRFGDDTGYYHDRNLAALQATMAGHFSVFCQCVRHMDVCDTIVPYHLWLPAEISLASDRFAATSLGFRDRAFFEAAAPERFFPWWEEGPTAQVVKNMALCKMWLDISWVPPATASERQDLENTLALIARAGALGAEFHDDEGAGDVEALLRGERLDTTGAPEIGYWRQDIWYMGLGGWSIALPATFRQDIGDDGQLCSLLSDDRAVYMRSYVFDDAGTQLEWPDRKTEGYDDYLRFETDQYRAVLQTGEMDEDEDGVRWFAWESTYNSLTGSTLVTVVSSHEDDAAWAEKVLRSVRAETIVDQAADDRAPDLRRRRPRQPEGS